MRDTDYLKRRRMLGEFVRWWRETVTPNKDGDRKSENQTPRPAGLILAEAEEDTGITHQQVSKWAKSLKDRDKYRVSRSRTEGSRPAQ